MKKFILSFITLFVFASLSIAQPTRLCYQLHLNGDPLPCPIEICIEQTVVCPEPSTCPYQLPPPTSTRECFDITDPGQICFWQNNLAAPEGCNCTVTSIVSFNMTMNNGSFQTVTLTAGQSASFLDILSGVTVSMTGIYFTLDCDGNAIPTGIIFESDGNGGILFKKG